MANFKLLLDDAGILKGKEEIKNNIKKLKENRLEKNIVHTKLNLLKNEKS